MRNIPVLYLCKLFKILLYFLFVICGLNNLSVSKRIVIYYIINSASLMASVQPSIYTFTHPSIYPYVARYRKKGWLWIQILFSYKSWVGWVIFIRKALLKSISILKGKPQLEESEPGKKRLCEIICFLFSVLFHLAWCSQIHPYCCRWNISPFYGWAVFHCIYMRYLYLIIIKGLRLFPCLGSCE